MKKTLLTVLVAAVTTVVVMWLVPSAQQSSSSAASDQRAFDRVAETRTLRCGYGLWSPVVMQDPNTGKLSGIFVDVMEELGTAMNIKIEWSHEVPWGQVPIELKTGKIDAMCAGFWSIPGSALDVATSTPVFFNSLVPVVRADDTRFDTDLMAANSPDVRFATMDSSETENIYTQMFPKATKAPAPAFSSDEVILFLVKENKADITVSEENHIRAFMNQNPGTLKMIHTKAPLRRYGSTIAVGIDEPTLLQALNTGIQYLHNSGQIEKILQKYEENYPNIKYRRVQ